MNAMIQLITPSAALMTKPVLMASHEQKDHVVPHFDHLNPRNAVVPLRMS